MGTIKYKEPIIFVHGIQGSWLKNHYKVDYQNEVVFDAILRKKYDSLHLSHLDPSVDKNNSEFIFSHQAIAFAYESLIEELRDEVTPDVYVFSYDWRKDNRDSAKELSKFIDLVLKKVTVNRKQYNLHHKNKSLPLPKKISLIGHSMGGLVIKWCVEKVVKDTSIIDKIISIATPYRGSLKAIEALLPGSRNFFGMDFTKSMRKASRTMPGLYQLLPSWEGSVVDICNNNIDIFKEESWQTNLKDKLSRLYDKDFFQNMLTSAKEFIDVVSTPYTGEAFDNFYLVYGKGSETYKKICVNIKRDNFFMMEGNDHTSGQGDGTVHRNSSLIKSKNVFVDDGNFLQDLLGGQHGMMTKHHDVQEYIINIFKPNKYINFK